MISLLRLNYFSENWSKSFLMVALEAALEAEVKRGGG